MFCALNGATEMPFLASKRQRPVTTALFPTSLPVPQTINAPRRVLRDPRPARLLLAPNAARSADPTRSRPRGSGTAILNTPQSPKLEQSRTTTPWRASSERRSGEPSTSTQLASEGRTDRPCDSSRTVSSFRDAAIDSAQKERSTCSSISGRQSAAIALSAHIGLRDDTASAVDSSGQMTYPARRPGQASSFVSDPTTIDRDGASESPRVHLPTANG